MTDKADLFVPRFKEDDVETPAGTIRVRGLSRAEVMQLKRSTVDPDELDARMLLMAVVDPKLSKAEVQKWREAWLTEDIDPIVERIAQLSGMAVEEDAEAAEVAREATFHDGPGQGV